MATTTVFSSDAKGLKNITSGWDQIFPFILTEIYRPTPKILNFDLFSYSIAFCKNIPRKSIHWNYSSSNNLFKVEGKIDTCTKKNKSSYKNKKVDTCSK